MSLKLRHGRRVEKRPAGTVVEDVWATSVLEQLGEEGDGEAPFTCSARW